MSILPNNIQRLNILLLPAIYALAWYLQARLFLNYDVSWLMHAAHRLLAGGSYTQNFFETNPPLILYLYLPVVLFNKWFGLNIVLAFRSYIFLWVSLTLLLCFFSLRKIFRNEDSLPARAFFLMLALVLLILPAFDFGQRDHLLVILVLPYLLLIVSRLQGESCHPAYAVFLGILAGLGFSIKPHFLITPLLLEIYYSYCQKNKDAWFRPEVMALLTVVIFYTLSIFIFQPDYIYIVVPYSLRLYYKAVARPWFELITQQAAVYALLPPLFYFFQRPVRYKNLVHILLLAWLGFFLAYLLQRMTHYYHLIPVLSVSLLLLTLLFASLLASCRRSAEKFFVILLAIPLFVLPVGFYYNLYANSLVYKKFSLNRLADFMNRYAKGAPVYFFVTAGSYAFPTIDYTTAKIAPRFYFLWMAAGLVNQPKPADPLQVRELMQDKNFLINMIADDLYLYKPRFVFVDLQKDKYRIKDKSFDYLTYFSSYEKFNQEWRHYHFFTLLANENFYKLGVYKRDNLE